MDPQAFKALPFPDTPADRPRRLPRGELLNALNLLNFLGEPIAITLRHRHFDQTITLPATPGVCLGDEVECRWLEPLSPLRRENYRPESFVVDDGHRPLRVVPELLACDAERVTFRLPASADALAGRRLTRYRCADVDATIVAGSTPFEGRLADFNARFLKVELPHRGPCRLESLHPQVPVNLTLTAEGAGTIYSGECRIRRQAGQPEHNELVLEPLRQQTARFRPREFRSERQVWNPSPHVVFRHPVTGRTVSLPVLDISGTGFAVQEPADKPLMLPGMIIPELNLHLTAGIGLACRVQVIYRREAEAGRIARCGLAILHMDARDHLQLLSLVQQARNPGTYLGNRVDLEDLWTLFFDAGFIYPGKYTRMGDRKDECKRTYEKLYRDSPTIARHFAFQENGRLLGHVAMLRLYRRTWISHHHAAASSNRRKAGFVVLDQLSHYINDSLTIDALNLGYIAGYFRPENRFPMKFLGGFADAVADRRKCSVDPLAFIPFEFDGRDWTAQDRWELTRAGGEDLEELGAFYGSRGGGLALEALDLVPAPQHDRAIDEEFARAGFRREHHVFAVRKNYRLAAVVSITLTDFGLNMSELTNAATLFVLDPDAFHRDDFELLLSLLCVKFGLGRIPVFVFPDEQADRWQLAREKTYRLWVLDTRHTDDYMRYIREFMRTAKLH
ncbi:MAG: PilZ domain-containing protein [Deltaproteobacteria bacterium]|nr:MAG: PilZ domain-containing protein [Deltaproteobacteria bacterium]